METETGMEVGNMEGKIRVEFMGGESREVAGVAVNYMLGKTDLAGESVELYAEVALPPEEVPEDFGYDTLKADILMQARALGISPKNLEFWYD